MLVVGCVVIGARDEDKGREDAAGGEVRLAPGVEGMGTDGTIRDGIKADDEDGVLEGPRERRDRVRFRDEAGEDEDWDGKAAEVELDADGSRDAWESEARNVRKGIVRGAGPRYSAASQNASQS